MPMTPVSLSVVMPVFRTSVRDDLALARVLESLRPQVVGRPRELVIVDSSGDESGREIASRWPWARLVARHCRTPQGVARNVGAEAARGRLLAFLDADAVPAAGWLDELERARPGFDMVGGAILNDFPESPCARAAHVLEFLEWVPPRSDPLLHAAGCNMLVERNAFESAGGFPTDVWTGEDTLLSFDFGRRGRLVFAPDAQVRHLNRAEMGAFVRDQYKHGVGFKRICERTEFPGRSTVCGGRVSRAVIERAHAVHARLKTHTPEYRRALGLMPLLAIGLCAWGRGLADADRRHYPALPVPARQGDG
ncbi:MAG: glycosyltransferase [Solirubrobacteraceae bacterium]